MKELQLRSNILCFLTEFKDLLGSNLDLTTLSISFFDISMLHVGLNHFSPDFCPIENSLFAAKIEPLDKMELISGFIKVK